MDVEVEAPKGLHHSRSEGARQSPARLPCHHLSCIVFLGCPEVRTFANKNTPPFRPHLPCLLLLSFALTLECHMRSSCQVSGGQLGICQQPARFCELINDISLSQEEQERRFLTFCQRRLMGEASEGG